ncbi:MAG: energy transducer TonB [Gemmatimonadota bacterium]
MEGPAYTPYDEGPQAIWDEEIQKLLVDTLLPVLRKHDLPARTETLLWVLIGPDGQVADAVVQTSSGNEEYDRAAEAVAVRMRFRPALRAGHAVPVWVIRDISLVMQ